MALCAVYGWLAVAPAAPGSRIVLATAGGSPDWLLGPWRWLGAGAMAGPTAGASYFTGLVAALALYLVVLARARALAPRPLVAAVVALHALFLLAPPLLSQDVFSYLAYARIGVLESLNPYEAAPQAVPEDSVFPFAGSKDAPSVYGPAFTLATYALVPLGVPAGLWALKAVAGVAALATVALVGWGAWARGMDPRPALVLVGLNPAMLVHVVGGAHNEALVVLVTTAGVVLTGAGRAALGAGVAAAAAAIKASAALVVPFLVLGGGRRAFAGATLGLLGVGAVALAAFGPAALDAGAVLGANQGHSSSWAVPRKVAELVALVGPGDYTAYLGWVRAAFAAGALVVLAWLALRTWRGLDPVRAAGWATVAVLVASGWLVPWYLAWLLPLAALAGDRRLTLAALALTAWTLPVAIPW